MNLRENYMISFRQSFLFTVLIGLALMGSFAAGYFVRDYRISSADLPILTEAHHLLLQYGLKEPPQTPVLEYGMIRGMLQAYGDPFTTFSEPVEHELTTNNLEGRFGGIGVQLQRDEMDFHILIPLPGSPAESAGILEGDRLVQVDDIEVTPETPVEMVQAALRGKVGSKVLIRVGRPPDYNAFSMTIVRAEFAIPSVTAYLAPMETRLGILKVNLMSATTPDEIVEAVMDLKERGAQTFALDLRDNYGGLLSSGVDTARLFLQDGAIMNEQYKGEDIKTYEVDKPGALSDLRFVILVNGNTASAAEITAGSLQSLRSATLIGAPTYGKDTIQLVFELYDKSSLQVTAARWWIPEDTETIPPTISGTGLQPEILVDNNTSSTQDAGIKAAVDYFYPDL
jgi:carboxyl-terminal processing protease